MTALVGEPAAHRRLLGPTARDAFERALARLPGDAASFRSLDPDAAPADIEVVLCGALCSVDDLDRAVDALRRAVGPTGRLLFLEHVGRPGLAGRAQRAAGGLLSRFPGGCRTDRDVPGALRRGGFVVTDLERFSMPTPLLPLRPWVRGIATPRREAA